MAAGCSPDKNTSTAVVRIEIATDVMDIAGESGMRIFHNEESSHKFGHDQ